jgi:hypothetical protein
LSSLKPSFASRIRLSTFAFARCQDSSWSWEHSPSFVKDAGPETEDLDRMRELHRRGKRRWAGRRRSD